MRIKRILIGTLIISLMIISIGCQQKTEKDCLDITVGTESQSHGETTTNVKHIYRITYEDIEFISPETYESWRDPLTKLLSNKAIPYGSGGEIMGYTYLYPDQPCIVNGYQLGLFDFDMDAVPELLVNLGGGSAGNAYYYVYDIITGELLGSLDGGFDKSWCTYFNLDTGKYENIGQFEWRVGWQGKERIMRKATLTNTMSDNRKILYDSSWLYAYYEIDAAELELTQAEIDEGIHSSWDQIYTGVEFRVNGNESYIGAYFSEYDFFLENYIRIPETALLLVDWDDVCDYDEDQTVRSKKMTDALLSSKQQFIQPKTDDSN